MKQVKLTPREKQIARLTRDGLAKKEIASTLKISIGNVKSATTRIFIKLGVSNSIELAVLLSAPMDSPFRQLIEDKGGDTNEY